MGAGRDQAGQAARVRAPRSGAGVRAAREPGLVARELRAVRPARAADDDGSRRRRSGPRVQARAAHDFARRPDGRLYIERVVLARTRRRRLRRAAGRACRRATCCRAWRARTGSRCCPTATACPRATSSPCSCSTSRPERPSTVTRACIMPRAVASMGRLALVRPHSAWYNCRAHNNRPGGRSNTKGGATKRGKCERSPGWGLRVRTRGDIDPHRQQLVAEPAGSQSEPDPGATNLPPTARGSTRRSLPERPSPTALYAEPGDTPLDSRSPRRRARATGTGSADLDHRPLQLPVHLLHAGRGHGLAAPRPAPHLRGDRPDRPGLRRALRLRVDPAHRRRAARSGPTSCG